MEYYRLDPWGEERGDLRAAIMTSNLYNVVVGAAGGEKFRKVEDFMLDYERAAERSSGKSGSRASKKPLSPERWKELKADFARAIGGGNVIR